MKVALAYSVLQIVDDCYIHTRHALCHALVVLLSLSRRGKVRRERRGWMTCDRPLGKASSSLKTSWPCLRKLAPVARSHPGRSTPCLARPWSQTSKPVSTSTEEVTLRPEGCASMPAWGTCATGTMSSLPDPRRAELQFSCFSSSDGRGGGGGGGRGGSSF